MDILYAVLVTVKFLHSELGSVLHFVLVVEKNGKESGVMRTLLNARIACKEWCLLSLTFLVLTVNFLVCQVLYIALPAILDTNPFQDTDEDSDKKPQEVETVISIFQTTYDVVKAYSVHDDIIHQLFAYLFFFTNASLFNTLMERGAGGKFYRWAKGAQIRGNLDLLESWAAQVQLQDEANEYLNRLSTAADLLATPKVQLLQVSALSRLPGESALTLRALRSEDGVGGQNVFASFFHILIAITPTHLLFQM